MKYHLVSIAKYQKWILRSDTREVAEAIFDEILSDHDFEIDTEEIAVDHVNFFRFHRGIVFIRW